MLVLPDVEEIAGLNEYPVLYWNHVGLQMNRITHSLSGPQGGPTMSSRALGLLHLAMHDAYFIALGHDESGLAAQAGSPPTYLEKGNAGIKTPREFAHLVAKADKFYGKGVSSVMPGNLENADRALTGAAITILDILYSGDHPSISIVASDTLTRSLSRMIAEYKPEIDILHPAHALGVMVAMQIFGLLGVKPGEPGADAGRYEPKKGPYKFRDEPVTPVRPTPIDPNDPSRGSAAARIYHGPLYGLTVEDFAVTKPDEHRLADYPAPATAEYVNALKEVVRLGGAAGLPTKRTPEQTATGYYWAYDGANLIGTPPRLYNQIIRVVAWNNKPKPGSSALERLENTSDFVRLLALANVAMADAGKIAWREKYRYELWRPLSGVREHIPDSDSDPFWLALGAPETNTNHVSFKPPFPAYPSGHATFGAAAFQILRLYYECRGKAKKPDDITDLLKPDKDKNAGFQSPDKITFDFVSEELNGVSRDLRQPYDPSKPIGDQQGVVRTRVHRTYESLWHAIFDNAFSRIYLGVHWRYDAASVTDIYQAKTGDDHDALKLPKDIRYSNVWYPGRPAADLPTGGVPLGMGIANDIFANGMRIPAHVAAVAAVSQVEHTPLSKRSITTYSAR